MVTGFVFKVMILFQIVTLVVAQQLPLREAPADVDPDEVPTATPTDSPLTPLIPTTVPVEMAPKNAVQNTLDGDIPQETRTILEAGLGGSKEVHTDPSTTSNKLHNLTDTQLADIICCVSAVGLVTILVIYSPSKLAFFAALELTSLGLFLATFITTEV